MASEHYFSKRDLRLGRLIFDNVRLGTARRGDGSESPDSDAGEGDEETYIAWDDEFVSAYQDAERFHELVHWAFSRVRAGRQMFSKPGHGRGFMRRLVLLSSAPDGKVAYRVTFVSGTRHGDRRAEAVYILECKPLLDERRIWLHFVQEARYNGLHCSHVAPVHDADTANPQSRPDAVEVDSTVQSPNNGASYHVRERLGSGSFAVVFRVQDAATGAEHALKWQPVGSDPQRVSSAKREALLHRQLRHRCIVGCSDVWFKGNAVWAITAYCMNRSLAHVIAFVADLRDSGHGNRFLAVPTPGTPDHFTRLFCDMADALAYCGRLGVVHCDVKPDNILVDASNTFKLADFGLSSILPRPLHYAAVERARGTVPYMAPEVFLPWGRGESAQLSPWTDAYSLGLTMMEALRLSRSPILGNAEAVRQFHELRRDVDVRDDDHPSAVVRDALRQLLQHSTTSRLTAGKVVEMLCKAGVYAASTVESVGLLRAQLRRLLPAAQLQSKPVPLPAPLATLHDLRVLVARRFGFAPNSEDERALDAEFAKIRQAYGPLVSMPRLRDCGVPFGVEESVAEVIREYLRVCVLHACAWPAAWPCGFWCVTRSAVDGVQSAVNRPLHALKSKAGVLATDSSCSPAVCGSASVFDC